MEKKESKIRKAGKWAKRFFAVTLGIGSGAILGSLAKNAVDEDSKFGLKLAVGATAGVGAALLAKKLTEETEDAIDEIVEFVEGPTEPEVVCAEDVTIVVDDI